MKCSSSSSSCKLSDTCCCMYAPYNNLWCVCTAGTATVPVSNQCCCRILVFRVNYLSVLRAAVMNTSASVKGQHGAICTSNALQFQLKSLHSMFQYLPEQCTVPLRYLYCREVQTRSAHRLSFTNHFAIISKSRRLHYAAHMSNVGSSSLGLAAACQLSGPRLGRWCSVLT